VEPAPRARRESPTTIFWRLALKRQLCRWKPRLEAPRAPAPYGLVELGHLVDEVMANFSDLPTCQLVLHAILSFARWKVRVCRSELHQTPFSRLIYLMVAPPGQSSEYIINFSFAEKFHSARQTPQLAKLLRNLPAAFVGTPEALSEAILRCSSAVEDSFTQLGLVIPPWRTGQQMQQLYFSCRAPEVCGVCHLLRCLKRSKQRGLSRTENTSNKDLLLSFQQFLVKSGASAPSASCPLSCIPFFIDAEAAVKALEGLQSPVHRCPLCSEDDEEDFAKIVQLEDNASVHSDLAKLLTATWYMRAPVRQARCTPK
jgi:uncharacterized protein (TIGR01615 family)